MIITLNFYIVVNKVIYKIIVKNYNMIDNELEIKISR